jgi:hypothetical protein
MRAKEFITEREHRQVKDQIIADVKKDGGNPDEYFVRFTLSDKLGFSKRQWFGRTYDVGDPEFGIDNIDFKGTRRSLWFYPLSTYLNSYHLWASTGPYVWLVKLKPNAWLQKVDRNDKEKIEAPQGKKRVGILRMSTPPAAIFFEPGYELVGKYYDYAGKHKRHGQVKGPPVPQKKSFLQKIKDKFISEEIEFDIVHKPTKSGGVEVSALHNGKEVGYVRFTNLGDNKVKAAMAWVSEKLRRRGIGSAMYKRARDLGFDIQPSDVQSDLGKNFWNKIHENND